MSPEASEPSEGVKRIVSWAANYPKSRRATRFRRRAYYVGAEMFLVVKPESVVLTALPEGKLGEARGAFGGRPFVWGRRTYPTWCEIPCHTTHEAQAIEHLLWASYRGAFQENMNHF